MKTFRMVLISATLMTAPVSVRADDASLLDYATVLGYTSQGAKILKDGAALTVWSYGVVEDAARLVSRVEMAGPCAVRVTTQLQDPPGWGQLQIETINFSAITGMKAFGNFDDLARQAGEIAITDIAAQTMSIHGKSVKCVSNYNLANDPEIYAYCDDRADLGLFDTAEEKAAILNALASVSKACAIRR